MAASSGASSSSTGAYPLGIGVEHHHHFPLIRVLTSVSRSGVQSASRIIVGMFPGAGDWVSWTESITFVRGSLFCFGHIGIPHGRYTGLDTMRVLWAHAEPPRRQPFMRRVSDGQRSTCPGRVPARSHATMAIGDVDSDQFLLSLVAISVTLISSPGANMTKGPVAKFQQHSRRVPPTSVT